MPTRNLTRTVTGTLMKAINFEVTGKNLTNSVIGFVVKKQGKLCLSKTVGDGITLTNATLGTFKINEFRVDLRAGAYRYALYIDDVRYVNGVWIIVSENG